MKEYIIATNNKHKVEEISQALGDTIKLVTLRDLGHKKDIPETSDTLKGNAQQKAQYIYKKFGKDCFADDTGLEVSAIHGEPGVLSARYAGPQRNAEDNINLLVQKLSGFQDPGARFLTVITLVLDGQYNQFEGTVYGKIISASRGHHGFGYDPIFIPDGYEKTFAEMTIQEKSKLSHRARAFVKLEKFLKQL